MTLTPEERHHLGKLVRQQIIAATGDPKSDGDLHVALEIVRWQQDFDERIGEALYLYGYAQGACHRRIWKWVRTKAETLLKI